MSIITLTNLKSIIVSISRYLIILLMVLYSVQSFLIFKKKPSGRKYVLLRQNISMFCIHFIAFVIMFLDQNNPQILIFYAAQAAYLLAALMLLTGLYPRASGLLTNNMCMLITIGFIMVTRLSFDSAVRQFKIVLAGTVLALIIPLLIRKMTVLTRLTWVYALMGAALLALVFLVARMTNGAKISLEIAGFAFQPTEFVKIIFVFATAGLLSKPGDRRRVIVSIGLAMVHVLILVVSRDLGSALIFFSAYLVMLFMATGNPYLVLAGVIAGIGAAIAAYFIFTHVKVRVDVWMDPFADYAGSGYQISQSLFSIAAGGWLGTGLGQGSPGMIPFVQQDFMFSAIAEEMGGIFAICLILVCMSCFIMFINVAMKLTDRFYRLVAVGIGATYATQVFLTVGGGMKLIPMTGVTLPLVSYGGSSALSMIAMFAIIQGLYMLRVDEVSQAGTGAELYGSASR